MDVLFFGTYDEDTHPRVRVLRQGFVAAGHTVTVCNAPLGFGTTARVGVARSPWRSVGLIGRIARRWWQLRRLARGVDAPDVVVVGYLGAFDVHLARRLFPSATLVLDQLVPLGDTVRDRGAGSSVIASALDRVDRAARQRADIVVFDTEAQRRRTPVTGSVVVPVGAAQEWFTDGPDTVEPPPLAVLYVGVYTPLHGTAVIGRAIASIDRSVPVSFTLVGDGQDRGAVAELVGDDPRVTWVDWVAGDDLPALHHRHHVALGIFDVGDKASRVVPTKAFQAQAAGCPVITVDTAPQREALGDGAVYVPGGDHAALAEAIVSLLDDAVRNHHGRAAVHNRERHRPREVITPLLEVLES